MSRRSLRLPHAPRAIRSALALAAAIAVPAAVPASDFDVQGLPNVGSEPLFQGDPIDLRTGEPALIVPGAPRVLPGFDQEYGTHDDFILTAVRGDVDLVVRTGLHPIGPAVPPPAATPAVGLAGPFGQGGPIAFTVFLTDGKEPAPIGMPVAPEYVDGLPFLINAFADLDGDGYVGITHLDGDTSDAALEREELVPVGRRYAIGRRGVAQGRLSLSVGGPPDAPVGVAITAAALAGPFDDPDAHCGACHGWPDSEAWLKLPMSVDPATNPLPNGPPLTTKVPFLPSTDPSRVFPPVPFERTLANADARVGARLVPAFEPSPSDPRIAESFTLALDGSEPTVDVARVQSGQPTHFGVALSPAPAAPETSARARLRPGIADDGSAIPVLVVDTLEVGETGSRWVRVVALDEQGNIASPTALAQPALVDLRVDHPVQIESPDTDGDPRFERIAVSSAAGTPIRLRAADDDGAHGRLVLEGAGTLGVVDLDIAVPGDDGCDDGCNGEDD